MAKKNLWTRNELIVSLNLYLKLPFGKLHHNTREIIELSKLIGRTPDAVAMRLSNFASVDPFHLQRGIVGLTGGRNQVEPIWNEFINHKEELLFESEKILAEFQHKTIESKFQDILKGTENLKGETKIREVKTRVNQDAFRQIVLVNYSCRCAITGIDIPELLVAGHILPWSKHEKERLNPQNGICLSPLYDKCFDKGLMGIDADYKIHLSKILKEKTTKPYFERSFKDLDGKKIELPMKFLPKKEFLDVQFSIFQKKNRN
ncbi:MAG: HNH endonuclease [Chitinophagales bacterium]|nr:HNH endonuclease [Chitinophagales bacterium]